ncbi:comF family protein [Selenomonas sp. oral taxon 138 str. F0429]|nr:comF family protein [Selenomonas sp. oral taxon 138 str. F0429]
MRRLSTVHALAHAAEMMAYLDGIWAFAHYREAVRDLLRALKYQKQRSALPALHTLLVAGEDVLDDLPRPLVAVPVPLAPKRQRKRGFNQAEEIFAPWLAAHGIALRPLLVRTRETAPLYEHTRTERQRELRGAFALAADADAAGRDILLVDDIMTSGATLTECARTLKRAGARRVYAFVLASEHL